MRYFFHIHDDVEAPDKHGLELPNIDAARSEAVRAAGEMLREIDGEFQGNRVWGMTVTDEAGQTVLSYHFSSTEPWQAAQS